ncbi:MAG: Spy/CpxP family protein refolding chaperone [Parabacteroides sp.]
MKKLIVLLGVALLTGGMNDLVAQNRGGRPQRMSVEEQVSSMKKELSLTDEQTEKVTALFTEFQKKREGQQGRPSREQMQADRQEMEKQLATILDEKQLQAYQAMRTQKPDRPKDR